MRSIPTSNRKFAIGIPTLNRIDLLLPALLYYAIDFPDTDFYIVDNGDQGINALAKKLALPRFLTVIENNNPRPVAGSWNQLCEEIFKTHENALILNDDVYLGKSEMEIKSFLLAVSETAVRSDFHTSNMQWSVFLLPKKTWEIVGRFDEQFSPAYFEDNDYAYRMKLLGLKHTEFIYLNPSVYRNTSTLEKATHMKALVNLNESRYLQKWGGYPGSETYNTPYAKLDKQPTE